MLSKKQPITYLLLVIMNIITEEVIMVAIMVLITTPTLTVILTMATMILTTGITAMMVSIIKRVMIPMKTTISWRLCYQSSSFQSTFSRTDGKSCCISLNMAYTVSSSSWWLDLWLHLFGSLAFSCFHPWSFALPQPVATS